jgi:hypothetical protein
MVKIVKNYWQEGKCTYNITLWRFRVIIVAVETQQCIFFHMSHKLHDYLEKVIERKMRVLIIPSFSV